MTPESDKTSGKDLRVPLFVVNTLLFLVLWAQLLSFTYRHWSTLPKDVLWLAITFPAPWIVTLGNRRNTGALIVGALAYGLLADAVNVIMHL